MVAQWRCQRRLRPRLARSHAQPELASINRIMETRGVRWQARPSPAMSPTLLDCTIARCRRHQTGSHGSCFMDSALAALVGALMGSSTTLVAAWISSKTQRHIAEINANKDIQLHSDKIDDVRTTSEVSHRRQKIEQLHIILSKISLDFSQTQSFMDDGQRLDVKIFRDRYRDNCLLMHEALAIIDMNFPDMIDIIRKIYGLTNVYWGAQEPLLKTNYFNTDRKHWDRCFKEILDASNQIGSLVRELQFQLSDKSHTLSRSLQRPCAEV